MAVSLDAVPSFLSIEEKVSMNWMSRFVRDALSAVRTQYRAEPVRVWICLAAFVASFGYALVYQITPSVDARKFHEIATHLASEGRFCFECNVPLAEDRAIRDIGPGYQFFLAAIYKVFGVRLWVVWFIQALMHAVVTWWIFGLVRRVIGSSARQMYAIVPVTLYAVHPDVIQNTAMLMSENLFVFLFLGLVGLFIRVWEKDGKIRWFDAAGIGVLSGVLMMVRPTGMPVLAFLLFVFALRRWWKIGLIVLTFAVLVQTPWAIRNIRLYDHFVLNSVVGGLDIWVGLDPHSPGEFNMDALPHITSKIAGLSPDQIDKVSLEEVKTILRERPLFVIQRTVQKAFKLFALTKTSAFWFHYYGTWDRLATLVLSVLFNLALLGMSFAAIWDVLLRRKLRHWIMGLSIVAVVLMAISPIVAVVVNRYRIPMLPFMTILSAGWLAFVTGRERRNSLLAAGATLVLATGVDLLGSWNKVVERIQRFK